MFYLVKPEVPGGLGARTVYDKSVVPWRIDKLHIVFDGWLGGNILKVSPCFFVTEQLKSEIEISHLTGVDSFEEIEVSKSDTFIQLYPNRILPKFYLLRISGIFGKDDVGVKPNSKLILSENALNVTKRFELSDFVVEELPID